MEQHADRLLVGKLIGEHADRLTDEKRHIQADRERLYRQLGRRRIDVNKQDNLPLLWKQLVLH